MPRTTSLFRWAKIVRRRSRLLNEADLSRATRPSRDTVALPRRTSSSVQNPLIGSSPITLGTSSNAESSRLEDGRKAEA